MDFLNSLFNIKVVFAILMIVIWIGYMIFSIAIVGKTRVLAKTLQTSLSAINVLVAWLHLFIVIAAGLIGILLIIL